MSRPLSPHLQVYKLPLTGLISITHRLTGVVLSASLVFFVYALYAIAEGTEVYYTLQNLLNTPWGKIARGLFTYALAFHFCHGIRHLLWDLGKSFAKEDLLKNAMFELVASIGLTIGIFLYYPFI
jgi:succinate dehydrogenase / fumarate reductase cytochrome b subunit